MLVSYLTDNIFFSFCRHQLLIYLPRFLFEKHFIQGILALTCDPVINVRVPLAVLLSGFEAFRKHVDKEGIPQTNNVLVEINLFHGLR